MLDTFILELVLKFEDICFTVVVLVVCFVLRKVSISARAWSSVSFIFDRFANDDCFLPVGLLDFENLLIGVISPYFLLLAGDLAPDVGKVVPE
jgi:hypothetical protein